MYRNLADKFPGIPRNVAHCPGMCAEQGNNWWELDGETVIAAWQPKGAASKAAAATDLTGNGKTLTEEGTVLWTAADGWEVDAAYIRYTTNIAANAVGSMAVKFSDLTTDGPIIGVGGTNRYYIRPAFGGYLRWYVPTENYDSPTATSGVIILTGAALYHNGSLRGTGTKGTITSSNIELLSLTGLSHAEVKIQAVAIYSTDISSANVATLNAAMAAL